MEGINNYLEQALDRFASGNDVTEEMSTNLRSTIASSPQLLERMNTAAEEGWLKNFLPQPEDMNAGATYSAEKRAVQIPLKALSETFDIHDMAFVLGHEVQHGFNAAERGKAVAAAAKEMRDIAKSPDPENHYDMPIASWQQAAREDEAKATIAGWNAALSQLKHEGKTATFDEMRKSYARTADLLDHDGFGVGGYKPKDGLDFNDDLSLAMSPQNVAAMGKYYYDNPDKAVGYAKSTYPNYTGATAVSEAIEMNRRHASPDSRILIDLQRHGMSEDKLEANGIDLRTRINREPRQPYIDTSNGQIRQGNFDHTYDDRVSPGQVHRHVPVDAPDRQRGFDDPSHPQHSLYETLKQRLPPETSEDRLHEITAACHMQNFRPEQVNQIAASATTVFITSNGPDPGQRVVLDVSAPPPTQQETVEKVEVYDRQQEIFWTQWREEQRQVNERAQQGPAMSL